MKNVVLFIVIFLCLLSHSQGKRKCRRNPCGTGKPLKDVHCHGNTKPCPHGYTCIARLCCPTSTTATDNTTTTPSTTVTTQITCIASPPNCPNGVVLDNTSGCPQCYQSPCLDGFPLTEVDGHAKLCDITNPQSCPNLYTCTLTETNQSVCCFTDFKTSTTPCPAITCPGKMIYNDLGCPECVYSDNCIEIPCPEGYYCLVESTTTFSEISTCVLQPCDYLEPYKNEQGITALCYEDPSNCPEDFSCYSVANDPKARSVCCPLLPTTTTTTITTNHCPPPSDCGGVLVDIGDECLACVYYDTCIQISCPEDNYCLVENITINHEKATCVQKPCGNSKPYESSDGITTLCTSDPSKCPTGFICSSVPNDNEMRRVCCPESSTTILEETSETTLKITSTACPPPSDCDGVLVDIGDNCPACVYYDTCIQVGCSDDNYCLVEDTTRNHEIATCVEKPCGNSNPYENDRITTLCTSDPSKCPNGFICSPVPNDNEMRRVCCPESSITSTSTTTLPPTSCPPPSECGGVLVNIGDDCPACVYYDTCIQVGCSEDDYCLVEDATPNNEIATCVLNPCDYSNPHENEDGITTFCTSDSSECPDDFECSPIPNDLQQRSVCCPDD